MACLLNVGQSDILSKQYVVLIDRASYFSQITKKIHFIGVKNMFYRFLILLKIIFASVLKLISMKHVADLDWRKPGFVV